MSKRNYYVYMLRCIDGSVYTGITTDLKRRMQEHFTRSDKCAKYTRHHGAKSLECAWKTEDRVLASKLEFYIKKLSKAQKEELIKLNDLEKLFSFKIEHLKYTRIDKV